MAEMILKLDNNVFNTISKIVSLQGINLKNYLYKAKKENFDLSPIELSQFTINNKTLKFNTPISFIPKLNDTKDLFFIEEDKFNISVYSPTIIELENDLKEEILFLWNEYAKSEENMTPLALKLKQTLLENIKEC
ncbi:MAG: hypothetical protein Ta2D_06670 [Rickettsiales bacterium]|nr:MAG: hypothetical protein Ta2D_06670 [Rickettsiales bacterium]